MKTLLEELYENQEINYIYENYKWTPSMTQWKEIKENSVKKYGPNTIVFFQLWTFFECYFHDAYLTSKLVAQTLTSKNKNNPLAAPMAGSPVKPWYQKAQELVKLWYNVIIVEEIGVAGTKQFQRVITQTLTPWTSLDTIGSLEHNFVYSISGDSEELGISLLEVSSNEFFSISYKRKDLYKLKSFFSLYPPKEILYNGSELIESFPQVICNFLPYDSVSIPKENIPSKIKEKAIKNPQLYKSIQYLLWYVEEIHKSELSYVTELKEINPYQYFFLEDTTVKNLEILKNSQWYVENSLLYTIRKTRTSFGGRLLRNFLLKPLRDKKQILLRQEVVTYFIENEKITQSIYNLLYKIHDIERLASKIVSNRICPNDILALKESLEYIEQIRDILIQEKVPFILDQFIKKFPDIKEFLRTIEATLNPRGGVSSKDWNIINAGIDSYLDTLIQKTSGKEEWYEIYSKELEEEVGFKVKVSENSMGAYIEVDKKITEVPKDWKRIKMLKDYDRYETTKLVEFYRESFDAIHQRNQLEYTLFQQLRIFCSGYITKIQRVSKMLAYIDVLLSFALLAQENNYTKPLLTNDTSLEIQEGRHPVIEKLCRFNKNDIEIQERKVHLITGPNMGGKSTYLRQTALIVLLAQIGSYIPASSSIIGIVDNIFTRIGASDNLTQGESTFFIEMKETSEILQKATNRSLVILDEVWRGTSTEEGEALSQAFIEYFRDTKIRTLFATHFHSLATIEGIENYFVEWKFNENGDIYFEHKIKKGSSTTSYGIEIAKLTGVPLEIIQRAYLIKEQKWN